jgi:circadian clock protein KaiC
MKAEIQSVLEKVSTGIKGFDEISGGGLPKGRPTLIAGTPGCGKTLFGMEFLVKGALLNKEPGVFISFEESVPDLVRNFASLGFDLKNLIARKLIDVEYIRIDRSEIEETGEYDLEALFIRISYAIDAIGAKRIVIDTIEALFSGLSNAGIVRAEIRRLFNWLKEKGITAVITGESGEKTLTRYGLEEYVADCVIALDFRVRDQIAIRRLRIIKYRGSSHGVDEYPFLIDKDGISILPITSLSLGYQVSNKRISSGIPRLDSMLGGKGFYRGSTVLISGGAGTGKTSFAAKFIEAACRRGERCLYFAFEESPSQILRNMGSIGIDLAIWMKKEALKFHAVRPSAHGLEMHLVTFHKAVSDFQPQVIIIDPISNLIATGTQIEVKSILTRLFDYLKMKGITLLMTDLTPPGGPQEHTNVEISSLIDTWILIRNVETNGERNRALYIMKSRGMAHSNQVREVLLSDKGIDLVDVYTGTGEVLTGTARQIQEAQESAGRLNKEKLARKKMRDQENKIKFLKAKIEALCAECDSESEEFQAILEDVKQNESILNQETSDIARLRKADFKPVRQNKRR